MINLSSLPGVSMPESFLWGAATAGHQVEGDNRFSDHYQLELERNYPEKSGLASNHWQMYREDVELMAALNLQAYRFSIEWSRIEPEPGCHDEEALAHYLDLLERLKRAGIRVFLTLHHFSVPQWFAKLGGFSKRENVPYFERHVQYLVPLVRDYVDFWMVSNEFNICGGNGPEAAELRANELVAHARCYHIIKGFSAAPVSSAHALRVCQALNPYDRFDTQLAELDDWMSNEFFFHGIRTGEIVFPYRDSEEIPELKGALDYWAVNYYTRRLISARKAGIDVPPYAPTHLRMIDRDIYLEEFYPEGFTNGLLRLKDKPIFITENGVCAEDDRWRVAKIALDLTALAEAMKRGADVRGYLHWSLLDNYEWGSFVPRFGLVHVDFQTFQRTPKPSAEFLRDMIAANGYDQALLHKYLPQMPDFLLYRKKG